MTKEVLSRFPALTYVYLQHNRLTSTAALAVLQCLKFLSLGHNRIIKVCTIIGDGFTFQVQGLPCSHAATCFGVPLDLTQSVCASTQTCIVPNCRKSANADLMGSCHHTHTLFPTSSIPVCVSLWVM